MKTPSHPVSPRPSPPQSRAQAPVTPALTLSHHLSVLALRTCHIFDLVPLPSTATATQMRRKRHVENNPLHYPRKAQGSSGPPGSHVVSFAAPFCHRQDGISPCQHIHPSWGSRAGYRYPGAQPRPASEVPRDQSQMSPKSWGRPPGGKRYCRSELAPGSW